MANFCGNCGATLSGVFCNKCGARAQEPSPVAQQPVPPAIPTPAAVAPAPVAAQPAAAAAKGSGIGKILLIVGGVLLLLFVMGVGAAVYGVYWVKHKVSTYASAVTGGDAPKQVKVEQGDSCRLLSKEDLAQVLGVAVERTSEIMEGSEPGCAYYTNPEAFTQLQRMSLEQARRDSAEAAKQPGPKTDNPLELLKDANKLEGVVKTFGLSQPDKDGKVFSFSVQKDFGRDNWGPLRATLTVVPGFEDVNGVGDHAMMGSFGHALYVLKGDSMVHLETTYVPDTKTRGAEIGRKIAGNL
jgi:hypothetical protein